MRFQLPQFILYAELTSEESLLTISSVIWKSVRKGKVQKHTPIPNKITLHHINWSQNILITYFIAHIKICNCMFYLFYQKAWDHTFLLTNVYLKSNRVPLCNRHSYVSDKLQNGYSYQHKGSLEREEIWHSIEK